MIRLSSLLLLLPALGWAQGQEKIELNTITRVEVKGGSVEITGSRKPSFTTFTMTDPPRLVIDISEAVFSGVPDNIQVGNGVVTAIKTASYGTGDRAIARILVGFTKDVETDMQTQGGTLVVKVLGAGGNEPVAAAQTPGGQEVASTQPAEIGNPPPDGKSTAAATERAEADRKQQEAEAREATQKAEADRAAQQKAAEESSRQSEADRIAQEKEAKAAAEAEKKAAAEAEKQRKAEEAKAAAEEKRRAAEEAKAAALEEKKQKAEEAKAAAEEKRRAAEEAKAAALEEQKRKAEEAKAAAEEKKRKQEEAKAAALEEKKRKAEEAKASAEEKRRAAEEAKAAALEEKKRKAEEAKAAAEEKRRAAEEAKAAHKQKVAMAEGQRSTGPEAGQVLSVSPRRKTLTFLGFKQEASSSRVFVRTNEPVRYSVSRGDKSVVIELENTRFGQGNTTRSLDTSYFDTAVAMVSPERAATQALRIEIKLKEAVPYETHQEGNEVFIDFQRPSRR